MSKVVVTFVAKSKSKLAVYTKVEWLKSPYGFKSELLSVSVKKDVDFLITLLRYHRQESK